MEVRSLLKGLAVGFSVAAPVGPVGVLCIRRTLAQGRWVGLVTGLGAATADAVYGLMAGLGLTAISSVLIRGRIPLRIAGGVFLLQLGITTFRSKPATKSTQERSRRLLSAYFSTVLLTLTNPLTVLAFLGIFAGFGVAASRDYADASILVFGVFAGSALWWLLLSMSVGLLQERMNSSWMRVLNQVAGSVIFGFGVYSLAAVLIK